MNSLKLVCIAGLFGLGLAGCSGGQTSNKVTNNPDGTIILMEGDGRTECSITATVGDHSLRNGDCKNDQYYSVRFVDIPSARNITFFDDVSVMGTPKCLDDEGWEFEVRTIKNPTTTPDAPYMGLASMYKVAPNTIITPGVLKIRHTDIEDQIYGKLSCIRIEDHK